MSDNVILCVGNVMMGDDGAGPMLAELAEKSPVEGWTILDSGAAPENDIGYVKELKPKNLIIFDATDMALQPGQVRVINPEDIAEMFIATTHNMPLTFLIDQLKETIPNITFIGVQPEAVSFYYPISDVVKNAVTDMYSRLPNWNFSNNGGYEDLVIIRDE